MAAAMNREQCPTCGRPREVYECPGQLILPGLVEWVAADWVARWLRLKKVLNIEE